MQQQLVTAQHLADALNRLRHTDPMWSEGGFRVQGRWLEIDPDASDALAARMLRCDIDKARRRNDAEARWLVAGGVGVVYVEGRGWQPAPVDPVPIEVVIVEPPRLEPEPEPVEEPGFEAERLEAGTPAD